MKLYREARCGEVIKAGIVKTPAYWYIAIPFWISLRRQEYFRDDVPGCLFGRRYYEFCIVFRRQDIFHLKKRAFGKQIDPSCEAA